MSGAALAADTSHGRQRFVPPHTFHGKVDEVLRRARQEGEQMAPLSPGLRVRDDASGIRKWGEATWKAGSFVVSKRQGAQFWTPDALQVTVEAVLLVLEKPEAMDATRLSGELYGDERRGGAFLRDLVEQRRRETKDPEAERAALVRRRAEKALARLTRLEEEIDKLSKRADKIRPVVARYRKIGALPSEPWLMAAAESVGVSTSTAPSRRSSCSRRRATQSARGSAPGPR